MSDSLPQDWIGAPLRSAPATSLEGSLPEAMAELRARTDPKPSAQTFGHDLTAAMPRLRTYARSLTRDSDAADDLVQDTMLKAWKARDQFAPGSSLRAWTATILRNLFLSQRRRSRFASDYDEQVAEVRLARPEAQSAVVELADVERAMEDLGPSQHEALRLVAIEGLSYEEGARRVGISLGSFKSRVWRGRLMLQSILNGDVARTASATAPKASDTPMSPTKRQRHHEAWPVGKAAGRPHWIG